MISPAHAWQNDRVLNMSEALLGSITPNIRGVTIETDFDERAMVVHFALARDDRLDREEIEEIMFSLDALAYWEFDSLETEVWVGDDFRNDWPGWVHRPVYLAWMRQ